MKRFSAANKQSTRREFLKCFGRNVAKVTGGMALLHKWVLLPFAYAQYVPEPVARLTSAVTHAIPDPIVAARNAIAARKIEEYIALKLKEELGRRPKIGIVYGAAHSGLKEDGTYDWDQQTLCLF